MKVNGFGSELDKTIDLLKEAEMFDDTDYEFTPTPLDVPSIQKEPVVKDDEQKEKVTNGSEIDDESISPNENEVTISKAADSSLAQRQAIKCVGRPKGSFKIKSNKKKTSDFHRHIQKLKKTARNSKGQFLKSNINKSNKNIKRSEIVKRSLTKSSRPHRHLSGKFSVGQLWRETFLEDVPTSSQQPDSALGSSSDQDTSSIITIKDMNSNNIEPNDECVTKQISMPDKATVTTVSDCLPDKETDVSIKPRLTMKIAKKSMSRNGYVIKSNNKGTSMMKSKLKNNEDLPLQTKNNVESDQNGMKTKSSYIKHKICKCSRLKHPNQYQMTCRGKKCPCFIQQRCCFKCLCKGCKNPFNTHYPAPSLSKVLRGNENHESSLSKSMPRLSPITNDK